VIAGICVVRNDTDVFERSVRHMLDQGVDELFITEGRSTDGTRELCWDLAWNLPITMYDQEGPFDQSAMMTDLAHKAGRAGADWVIPWDADEFWITPDRTPVAKVIDGLTVSKIQALHYGHADWQRRELASKPLGKVVFRYQPGLTVRNGNHDVEGLSGDTAHGVLEVRELQWRSFDHFCRKVTDRLETLNPTWPAGEAAHYRALDGASETQLQEAWDQIRATETVHDPIT